MGKKEQTIYTCDRCGAEMSKDATNRFGLRKYKYIYGFNSYTPTDDYDEELYLCVKCVRGLYKYLKGGVVNS